MSSSSRPIFGLVPAAGKATRLGHLASSKEVLPLPPRAGSSEPAQPACASLLSSFAMAGVNNVYCLLRQGKWDIPTVLGEGEQYGLNLAYLVFDQTASVPETLDKAFPFIAEGIVALGFPDILFEPPDAYRELLRRYRQSERSGRRVILGLFPTDQCWKADMVEVDTRDRVRDIVIKQPHTDLAYTWSIAVWGPEFSRYLRQRVRANRGHTSATELYVGDVIRSALAEGFEILAVRFDHGSFLDIGTPADLERASAGFTD